MRVVVRVSHCAGTAKWCLSLGIRVVLPVVWVLSSYMQELYYDRQAGLVRMVSLAGEVWERVP